MKKLFLITFALCIIAGSYLIHKRYTSNVNSVIPVPYVFKKELYQDIDLKNVPIVIIGDRLAYKLGSFTNLMAQKISLNLSKKVKIYSLAQKGESLHRTLKKIKSLHKLPLITIYLGGSQEYYERKFSNNDIQIIQKNFDLYKDDRIKTLLMIYPHFSKFLYHNVSYQKFDKTISEDLAKYTDIYIQKRNMINFRLYKEELHELFSYIKEKGSFLFAITQPFNYDIAPKKSCKGSIDEISAKSFKEAISLIKKKDLKKAYSVTKNLTLIANNNAKVHYIHGKVAKSLGKNNESLRSIEMSIALDCKNWRGNPVYNKILTEVANKNEVLVFDFDKFLLKESENNITFEDEIYPQNFYYEKLVGILSDRIRKLLKL